MPSSRILVWMLTFVCSPHISCLHNLATKVTRVDLSASTPSSPTGLVFVTFCRECLDPSESGTPYRSQPPPFTNPDCQEKSDDYKTVSCFYSFFFQVSWSDLGSRPQQQLKLIQVTPGRVFWLNLDWMLQEGGQAEQNVKRETFWRCFVFHRKNRLVKLFNVVRECFLLKQFINQYKFCTICILS